MSAYLLLFFLHLPDGSISARSYPNLLVGADQCLALADKTRAEALKAGHKEKDFTVLCVDSKLYPGNPA